MKYKYDLIVIKLTNVNDFIRIQKYMFNNNILWCNNGNSFSTLFDRTDSCFIHLYVILNKKDVLIKYTNKKQFLLQNIYYDKTFVNKFNSDLNIYTIINFNQIKSIVEYGTIIPTYRPKKTKRIL